MNEQAKGNFYYIKSSSAFEESEKNILNYDILFMDTETTGLDPIVNKIRLLQIFTGKDVYVIDFNFIPQNLLINFISKIKNKLWVFHNAKFDIKFLYQFSGIFPDKLFDTMIAFYQCYWGAHNKISLKNVYSFLGLGESDEEIDKTLQTSDWTAENLSNEQIKYAALDVIYLKQIYDSLVSIIKKDNLERSLEIDFQSIIPLSLMELNGIGFDYNLWREIEDKMKILLVEKEEELNKFFGRSINYNSPKQLKEAFESIGLKIPATNKTELIKNSEKFPICKEILEFRTFAKRINSYGESWTEYINPITSRIHPEFKLWNVKTGRLACSNPNLQQIPHESDFRRSFIPSKGCKFIIADYSQIEIRMLAEVSGDVNLISALNSGNDLHKYTGHLIFNLPIEDIDDKQRYIAKQLNFSIVYGIGAKNLSIASGISEAKAKDVIKKYHQIFEGVSFYISYQSRKALLDRYCETLSGRKIMLQGDRQSVKDVWNIARVGVNAPIQGTCAEIIKLAMIYFTKNNSNSSLKLVNTIHDELVLECPEELLEEGKISLLDSMQQAAKQFIKKVPVEIDLEVKDSWV